MLTIIANPSGQESCVRGKTRDELLKLQQSFAVPIVVITHDPADVEAFAEDLIVFDIGIVARQISVEC